MSTSDEDGVQGGTEIEPVSPLSADADQADVAETAEQAPTVDATDSSAPPLATAAGRVWVTLVVGVVVMVLLIIFVAENSGGVTVSFLGAHGKISLGLAMLIAAVAGAVVTLLVGTTRILQLRREVRRHVPRS